MLRLFHSIIRVATCLFVLSACSNAPTQPTAREIASLEAITSYCKAPYNESGDRFCDVIVVQEHGAHLHKVVGINGVNRTVLLIDRRNNGDLITQESPAYLAYSAETDTFVGPQNPEYDTLNRRLMQIRQHVN